MTQPVFRFAPSPNGYMHAGHAASALHNEAASRMLGGRLLLRIENIDYTRCRGSFETALIEDLAWLGIRFEPRPMRQSDRFATYGVLAKELRRRGLIYPCFCTRNAVANAATARDPEGAPLYPGTCRHLDAATVRAKRAEGLAEQWRLDMAGALAITGPLGWDEGQPGLPAMRVEADPLAWGDVVVVRKEFPASYPLAVVADDAHQGITHVVRGADLFAQTAIQRVLQTLFGFPAPRYWHHPLILDMEGLKLAKSRASLALRDLRAAGITPRELRQRLGFA